MSADSRHGLIIEDEMLIALEIEAHLRHLGFLSFDIADSPQEALILARGHPPDLITADYRILEGTGPQAVEAILTEIGVLPVIYVTGNVDMVRGLGFPVVEKPIVYAALEAAVDAATP